MTVGRMLITNLVLKSIVSLIINLTPHINLTPFDGTPRRYVESRERAALWIVLLTVLVLMGLRGGCGVGAAGCLWIVVFGTLLRLELEGSREGILYDEIDITILN